MWPIVGLVLAIGIAIQAQGYLLARSQEWVGIILYIVAVALALPSFPALEIPQENKPVFLEIAKHPVGETGFCDWRWPWLLASLVCTALATMLSIGKTQGMSPVIAWIAGIGFLIPAFARATHFACTCGAGTGACTRSAAEGGSASHVLSPELALIGAILLAGFVARAYHIDSIPPIVHGDEAQSGLQARAIMAGKDAGFFTIGWYNQPIFSFALQSLSMGLFGDNITGLRLASAFFGTLALLPFYLLVRLLFRPPTAALATILLAVSYWPVHFSRIGINYIQTTCFEVLAWYFLVRGLRRQRALDFALCGITLSLGLYSYYASRLVPVLLAMVLGWQIIEKKPVFSEKTGFSNLLALALAALVTFAPQGVYFLDHPHAFTSRTSDVWIFNNMEHAKSSLGTDNPLQVLWMQAFHALLIFNYKGDTSVQYGFSEPVLDRITAALFVLGLALALWRLRRWPYSLLQLWLWLTLFVGCVLTVDSPFGPRLVGAMPVPFIFAVLPIAALYWRLQDALPRAGQRIGLAVLVILAGTVSYVNYDAYVNRYAGKERRTNDIMELAATLTSLGQDDRVYLLAAPERYIGDGTLHFLAPQVEGVNVYDVASVVPITQEVDKNALFIFWPSQADRLPYVQLYYPGGQLRQHRNFADELVYTCYLVPREKIKERQGLVAFYYPPGRWDGQPLASLSGVEVGDPPPGNLSYPLNTLWRGTLYAPGDARYLVALDGSEAALWLDGELVLRTSGGRAERTTRLAQGPHALQIRATTIKPGDRVSLSWAGPEEELSPVPRTALSVEPQAHGLLGDYVYRRGEGGQHVLRIDQLLAFRDLAPQWPGPLSVEWQGGLNVSAGGLYAFQVTSYDGAWLSLDGHEIIADRHQGPLDNATGQVELNPGCHDLRIHSEFIGPGRWLELRWLPPGGDWSLVPAEALIPYYPCRLGPPASQ
jgi:4-amino-4-deoxy-L-arabinose transferase-like glycosyltransferase